MNPYQQEQYEAHDLVLKYVATLDAAEKQRLEKMLGDYLAYRKRVDAFLQSHFTDMCTQSCYQGRRSACCSREGIITFFADVVINVLCSPSEDINRIMNVLQQPNTGVKCIYLTSDGCRWKVKPVVCALFLCDAAIRSVFSANPDLQKEWEALRNEKKRFTWPDQPVLFEYLEAYFIKAQCTSSLMYLHNSPGLLRIKKGRQVSSPSPETRHGTCPRAMPSNENG